MRHLTGIVLSVVLAAVASAEQPQWHYPPTKTGDAADTYFGRTYADPYRWLEDLKDPAVEAWFRQQADLTESALKKIKGRAELVDEWMALDKLRPANYADITVHGGQVFYKKTLGGENVGKLFVRQGMDGKEELLFDPTTYAKGTPTVVQSFMTSWDGKHVVLGLTAKGAEWSELRVLDVDKRELLPDRIYPSYGAWAWAADNASFYYDAGKTTDIKSNEIELNRKARLHKLGTAVEQDVDLLSDESHPEMGIAPKEMPWAWTSEEFPGYLFAQVSTVQKEVRNYYAMASEISTGKVQWKPICGLSDDVTDATFHDGVIYALTHAGAPKYKLVRADLKNLDWSHADVVLPEAADTLKEIAKSRHYLFAVYSNGVTDRLVKYEFATGKPSEVKLPGSGTIAIDCPDWRGDLCHLIVTSWTEPPVRYDYDATGDTFAKSRFWSEVKYPGFEDLVAEEVEVPGHDGLRVPLSILHRKDTKLDGSNCCILEGYGAYGMSMSPHFSILHSVAKRGVVLAFAHPRGGGEKGEDWYKAGYKTTKPNTWKDFIACGEYLVAKGYTSPEKLAGTGTSAGGILISRAITERPDLFRAAVCNVGCANALRFEFSPNGPVNAPEFGTLKDEAECRALAEMDGVSHVKDGVTYPAVLGVAGWNDPRVSPWQPGKFIAAVQRAAGTSGRPAMLKVNYDNGHFTEEKVVTFNNFASQTAFMLWQTGHPDFQPKD